MAKLFIDNTVNTTKSGSFEKKALQIFAEYETLNYLMLWVFTI